MAGSDPRLIDRGAPLDDNREHRLAQLGVSLRRGSQLGRGHGTLQVAITGPRAVLSTVRHWSRLSALSTQLSAKRSNLFLRDRPRYGGAGILAIGGHPLVDEALFVRGEGCRGIDRVQLRADFFAVRGRERRQLGEDFRRAHDGKSDSHIQGPRKLPSLMRPRHTSLVTRHKRSKAGIEFDGRMSDAANLSADGRKAMQVVSRLRFQRIFPISAAWPIGYLKLSEVRSWRVWARMTPAPSSC